ncbi:MAG: type II secretion system F family protein [Gemmataceae bacterium]
MLFSSRLPTSNLIELSRVLRHNLSAGLTLRNVFDQQAKRGPMAVRPVAERISKDLQQGQALEDALKKEARYFPPLFLNLAVIGEQSGMLPEIFAELEKYYALQQKLRRDFIAQITWPMVQFVASIFVVAGLILIMGILPGNENGKKGFDPVGLGTGPVAAIRFLVGVALLGALAVAGYFLITRKLLRQGTVESFLLRVPVIGPCLHALALTRFCLALRLMHETGMSIVDAVSFSLRATDNGAYVAASLKVENALREGDDLTAALAKARVFPDEFINIVATAEEGGRLPDVLKQQTEYYEEEARRRMSILTQTASWGVWLFVAILIIVAIFRIFFFYIQMIQSFIP